MRTHTFVLSDNCIKKTPPLRPMAIEALRQSASPEDVLLASRISCGNEAGRLCFPASDRCRRHQLMARWRMGRDVVVTTDLLVE
jgi:hypothetical protein